MRERVISGVEGRVTGTEGCDVGGAASLVGTFGDYGPDCAGGRAVEGCGWRRPPVWFLSAFGRTEDVLNEVG